MQTYLTFMLIRFGLIAAVLIFLALLALTAVLLLKRKGHLTETRRYTDPALRAARQAAHDRLTGGPAHRGDGHR